MDGTSSEFSLSESEELSLPYSNDESTDFLPVITYEEHPAEFDSWAPDKQKAWLALNDNPNAFFYRHVMPGTKQKHGSWNETEKNLFIKMIHEHPPTSGHWGLFSRNIPGRVGYQCNAFFRKLVALGELPEFVEHGPKLTIKEYDSSPHPITMKKKRYSATMNDASRKYLIENYSGKNFSHNSKIDSTVPSFSVSHYSTISVQNEIAQILDNPSSMAYFKQITLPLYE